MAQLAVIAQWADRYQVSCLGTGSNPEQVCKGPMGRCKATTHSSLSLTINTDNLLMCCLPKQTTEVCTQDKLDAEVYISKEI